MRLHIVIATVGRAELLCRTVALLSGQTRQPDGIVIVATAPADIAGLDLTSGDVRVLLCEKGLCRQRNRALDALKNQTDAIIFFDDDFIPAPDYLASVEALFRVNERIVGITGDLLGDGVLSGGYTIEQAMRMISARQVALPPAMTRRRELYGCNMAIRAAAIEGLRFDENLPLYGWQEDVDFTSRLGRRGELVASSSVTGVHLGTSGGRTSGRRLGYSQIANVLYLRHKGTMRAEMGNRLMSRNFLANLLGSMMARPGVDRRGRLLGNLVAVRDCLRGELDPRRILTMREPGR
jgi:GT2 family glycosyltransferase